MLSQKGIVADYLLLLNWIARCLGCSRVWYFFIWEIATSAWSKLPHTLGAIFGE